MPIRALARNYHATQPLRQHEQTQLQDDESSSQREIEQSRESSAAVREPSHAGKNISINNEAQATELDDVDIEAETLRDDVRLLMRKVPSSVAVITVKSFDPDLGRHVPMGVAVSSLSTVTLDPPTISFNIKQPSKTLDAIKAADGRFRVYFPTADRGGAAMVQLFSRGNHPDAYKARTTELRIYVPGYGSHAKDTHGSPSHAPQIFSDSVRAVMECTISHELAVADHVILVAKVDSMESKSTRDRTIIYVDGMYMCPDGTQVTLHNRPTASTEDSIWTAWDYPLFPGEEERSDYVKRIKDNVASQVEKLKHGKEYTRELERSLALSPSAWGINLEVLIDECRQEAGKLSELPAHLKDSPIMSDFWGRLSPSDRAKLIERAKDLIKEDAKFLTLNYRVFLQHLRASTSIIDLLPSDILEPLRAEGLVGPFQPRVGDANILARYYNLQYLEQVEHRLMDHFATLKHEEALNSRLDEVLQSLGESRTVASYFKKSRARLYAAASPELYKSPAIDIFGEVSPEEACVIMRRVVHFLQVGNIAIFRNNINLDFHETLRLVGVHPSITGFNVEFFLGKIKHLYYSSRFSRDTSTRVEKMLEPFFIKTISWGDLEEKVKIFVEKMPLRAMSWSIGDKLAAMGLDWESLLTVPISKEEQPLNTGTIIDTLVAKELKSLYGKSTEELNKAIARYLKKQYNYQVGPQPTQQSTIEAQISSSSDDMEEAMAESLNVNVRSKINPRDPKRIISSRGPLIRTHGTRGSIWENRLVDTSNSKTNDGTSPSKQVWRNTYERKPANGPRIRIGARQVSDSNHLEQDTGHGEQASPSSAGSWTGYSLGGGKKGE
jgi:flavin reductase (DIM6/NTAB) family NADH-FMN oxidoreductase RutF